MMEENPYINLLRLDSCFHFLTLLERIELHYLGVTPVKVSKERITIYDRMMTVLKEMNWEVPEFTILTENEDGEREWAARGRWRTITQSQWAKEWLEDFEEFKKLAKI